MPSYLLQVGYGPQAWAAMVRKPQNRAEAVKGAIEKLGGKITGFWFTFGEDDVIAIMEMPDNVSAAAFSLAVAAGGACRSCRTTPLLTIEEGMEAMKKAGGIGYKPAK